MPMPGIVTRGSILKKSDAAANDPQQREALLNDLNNWDLDYVEILIKYAALTPGEAQFLRDNWFTDNGWWQNLQPIVVPTRQSLITAREVAMEGEERLPIESYWVCVSDRFDVALMRSASQITRLLLTPPPGAMNLVLHEELAPIWTIKLGGEVGEQIVATANHTAPGMTLSPRDQG